ncbi:MAG: hypothetical protein WEB00_10665 [Dehalococcoidia bacterium]
MTQKSRGAGKEKASTRGPAEWVTLAISVAIVAGILGVLAFQQFEGGSEKPVLTARIELSETREAEGHFYLPITVANSGHGTAGSVAVELLQGDDPEPLAEFDIIELPGESEEKLVAILDEEPGDDLKAVVVSYQEP